ncbi:MAG: hypothetical protein JSV62_04520 [Promethearchaeota archaeon]|nr:MAG: hypothetical protein JSV62_04520 [Candidatus Lokiarchaeota archaeon]
MELFQIFWDDQNKLFLEFKKNNEEQLLFLPEQIKRLTIRFEISKQDLHHKEPPYLISIKKIYHSSESLSFTIELDELLGIDGLQLKILRLTIFLYSGQQFEYLFAESFKISDISVNEECYNGFEFEELRPKRSYKGRITQEKLFQEIKTNFQENKEQRTLIYQKSNFEESSQDNSLVSLITEGNKTLKRIEQALNNLSFSFQNAPSNTIQYIPSVPLRSGSEPVIERIKGPTKPALIQGQMSSGKLMVIREMKSIFKENIEKNSIFNIKDVLKPLTEEELKSMVLDEEELIKREQKAIDNQIKRLKKHQKDEIKLEELKPPKK